MKNIFKILMLTAVLVISSCADLDQDPFNSITTLDTEDEVAAVLLSAYTALDGLMGHEGYLSGQEVSSDEIVIAVKGGDWGDGGQWTRTHQGQWTPDEPFLNNAWNGLYSIVNQVNSGLADFQGNPGLTPALESELRALRTLGYYMLLDLYGNVRVITESQDMGQMNRTQVYNFILSEIQAIKPNLTTSSSTTYGRMNYWVMAAIEAKMKLNAEVYTGTADWAGALTACNDILDNGPFGFENNYQGIFDKNNAANPEHIFAIPYDNTFSRGFVLPQMTLHYDSGVSFGLTEQPWNGYATLTDFYSSYIDPVNNPGPSGNVIGLSPTGAEVVGTVDGRLSNFVVGPQFAPNGDRILDKEPGKLQADEPDGAPLTYTPYINELEDKSWRQAGARVGKYAFSAGDRALDNDFPVFRYTDILLMKAEALWRINPADGMALTLVNRVRDRAGVDDFGSLDADKLLAERGREMFYEGWRRNDLIRFGKFSSGTWQFKTAPVAPTRDLFPIPRAQVDGAGLTQNPGY